MINFTEFHRVGIFAFGFGFSASFFFDTDISCWKGKFSSSVCKIFFNCFSNGWL